MEGQVLGRKTRGLGREVVTGQTLNGFMVLVKECILREERVWKGCMPDSSMISFAVLIVK